MMMEVVRPDLRWPTEPYPGLRPFRVTSDADETLIFYGRNQHKDEILDRLDKQQMVILTGPSGCGKSSLLLAGVLPVLRAGLLAKAGSDWQVIRMRPRLAPIDELCAAIGDLSSESPDATKELLSTVPGFLSMLADDIAGNDTRAKHRILLVIDQFEEIFGPGVPTDQVDQLVRLIVKYRERPHSLLYIIVAMRSDFLGFCTRFPGLAQAINETQFLTPVLGMRELTEAIVRPAEDYGAALEKPLLDRLLTDMRPGAEYDPDNLALLQHALQWLWREARTRRGLDPFVSHRERSGEAMRLDLRTYETAGGLKGILNRHADEIAGSLSVEDKPVMQATLVRLAEKSPSGGYRRSPARIRDIVAVSGRPEAVRRVIDRFSDRRVEFLEVKSSDAPQDAVVDICHEALIRTWRKYKSWIDEEDFKVTVVRRVAADALRWSDNGRRDRDLDSGPIFVSRVERWRIYAPTEVWADRYSLSAERAEKLSTALPVTEAFLAASRGRAAKEKLKLWVLVASLVGIIFGAPAFFFIWNASVKQRETRELRAGAVEVLANEALSRNDAAKAMLWTREGLATPANADTRFENLAYRSLQQLHLVRDIDTKKPATSVVFSPDANYLLVMHENATVDFFAAAGGEKVGTIRLPDNPAAGFPFAQARWSKHGNLVAFSGKSTVSVIDVCGYIEEFKKKLPSCLGDPATPDQSFTKRFGNSLTKALFSPDGEKLVIQDGPTFFADGTTMVYDVKKLMASKGDTPPDKTFVNTTLGAAFNAASTELAVGFVTGDIKIYRTSGYAEIRALQPTKEQAAPILALSFQGTSNDRIYSGSFGGGLDWDVNAGTASPFGRDAGPIFQVLTTPDGTWIASPSDKGTLSLRLSQHTKVEFALGPHPGMVRSFDIGDSDHIASTSGSTVFLWTRRAALAPRLIAAPGDDRAPSDVTINNGPGTYEVVKSGILQATFQRPKGAGTVSLATEDPTGALFALAEEQDGQILVYRKGSKAPFATIQPPRGVPRTWASLRFEQNEIVAVSEQRKAFAWPYFKDIDSLRVFMDAHVPFIGDAKREELDPQSLCLITPGSACQSAAP